MGQLSYKSEKDLRSKAIDHRPVRIQKKSWDNMCETLEATQLKSTLTNYGVELDEQKSKEKKATKKADKKPAEKKEEKPKKLSKKQKR